MPTTKIFAVFYTEQIYYLPQFLPVANELQKRNLKYLFVFKESAKRDIFNQNEDIINICKKESIPYQIGTKGLENTEIEYLISGNSLPSTDISYKKSVFIAHGIGTKTGNFSEDKNIYDIRFVEGEFRLKKLKELYPQSKTLLNNVGFSKLDSVLALTEKEIINLKKEYGLDPKKKTILYAPTFYPSSIENMGNKFPEEFSDYNIIVKAHHYTYLRKRYKAQRKKLNKWKKYSNVYFAEFEDYNISPFYAISDILISDESSVVFEFAALDKPVILNRFIKLRLSYRLFGKHKLKKRMESSMDQFRNIGENVNKYKDLKKVVDTEIQNPERYKARRAECTYEIIGPVDGKVSVRMVNILEQESALYS
ncbi:hypothetical protein EO244_09325 [Ancylomarina salipaludis]|uniref:CDP-glycerol--poly(Glycerophosphate) glycerophosphotransferase n=1 Tax=Ancylomarina salipaludis TaxID=2501299 RepID=A0A4Q1JL78_9BACT|nr:CDP-glycerol glycerophosphotransferase family protein [Ancylomarina salipaludis]RXQ94473.1 hypothetical protein EO244_09325 [Ancylomarina salipaludis]